MKDRAYGRQRARPARHPGDVIMTALRAAGTSVDKMAAWVRAEYPPDAPPHGHVPLLALCGTDLPPSRTELIADELRGRLAEVTDTDIGTAIVAAVDRLPRPSDIERVRVVLEDGTPEVRGSA